MARAVALISGGLDSLLAAKIVIDQGVHVEGLNFIIGFEGKNNPTVKVAEQLGIKLHVIDITDEFKEVLANPKHGYGMRLNPCLDCKILMVKKAKQWLEQNGFDFMITGEIVGQRPKSQRRDTMRVVIKESGTENLLLRPLCVKNSPLPLPEQKGWINRELLYNFNGRSRKPQIELAKQLGIINYPQPAGGCLLTDKNFCDRLLDLWRYRGKKDYSKIDLDLLKIGRHLCPKSNFKIILGRNEAENNVLEKYCKNFTHLYPLSHLGPLAILQGDFSNQDINLAARIVARFSKGREAKQVQVQVVTSNSDTQIIDVKPISANEIPREWYVWKRGLAAESNACV
ncbi:MAG: tRNA (5-methylaminomethyl-2-thiouridylate)-methyltransferase [Coxiella sp. DG_40]|nr:MAG: tRNA (5-methylaminomethyl-2-thiouridylate)-methyltransferase [Coxiella sp. DG_40]